MIDRCKFDLRVMRNGFGLGLPFAEVDEMEWSEARVWWERLGDWLRAQRVVETEEQPAPSGSE